MLCLLLQIRDRTIWMTSREDHRDHYHHHYRSPSSVAPGNLTGSLKYVSQTRKSRFVSGKWGVTKQAWFHQFWVQNNITRIDCYVSFIHQAAILSPDLYCFLFRTYFLLLYRLFKSWDIVTCVTEMIFLRELQALEQATIFKKHMLKSWRLGAYCPECKVSIFSLLYESFYNYSYQIVLYAYVSVKRSKRFDWNV